MVWLPGESAAVLNDAVVVPFVVLALTGLATFVPSITNCTVPVGVPEPGVLTLTVAVKVAFWPQAAGLVDTATAVLLLAFVTVWVNVAEVLGVKFESPL